MLELNSKYGKVKSMLDKNKYSFLYILWLIRKRQPVILKRKAITELLIFVSGYDFSLTINQIKDQSDEYLSGFEEWFCEKFNFQYGSELPDFAQILLKVTNNDEALAFDLYYVSLDEFFRNTKIPPAWFD